MSDLNVAVKIVGQDQASGPIGAVSRALGGLGSVVSAPARALGGLTDVFGRVGLAGMGLQTIFDGLSGTIGGLVGDAVEAEKIAAATDAVIRSTRGVAGMTAEAVSDLATALSRVTPFEDEAVQGAENLLLTFTSISREVFPAATETVLDMSQALGQDLKSSAVQLGKALNDPIRGVTALRRVGVQFTEAQVDQIKTLVNSGRVLDAQKLILKELQTEFGGAARAAGQTFAGKLTILNTQVGNVREAIAGPLIEALSDLLDWATPLITTFGEQIPRAFEWLGQTWRDVTGYLAPGNRRDLMREWFGPDFGPRIDEAVRGLKQLGSVLGDVWGRLSAGDLGGAVGLLGQGVGDLAGRLAPLAGQLAAGLGELWARIDWAAIWQRAQGIGSTLVSGAVRIATDVATWLGNQWAAINWAEVWSRASGLASGLLTGAGQIAATVTGWLSDQWSRVDWGLVWSSTVGIATQLASGVGDIYQTVTAWLSEQWARIDWADVWAAVQDVGAGLSGALGTGATVVESITAWLGEQMARVDWGIVFERLPAWDAALADWIDQQDFQLAGEAFSRKFREIVASAFSSGTIARVLAGVGVASALPLIVEAIGLTPVALAAALIAPLIAPDTAIAVGRAAFEFGAGIAHDIVDAIYTPLFGPEPFDRLTNWIGQMSDHLIRQGQAFREAAERLGQDIIDGIVQGLGGLNLDLAGAITAELEKLRVDIGPFHLSSEGFRVDVPTMPQIAIPELPRVPGLASGASDFAGGWALVGERGPELLHLPRGSDVIPLANGTRPGAIGDINVTININGPADGPTVERATRDGVLQAARAMGLAP